MDFRYFIFLYPEDRAIQELLDLAVFLMNPDEKWRAHVTLAGPFGSARHLPRKTEFRRKVSIAGVGQFRSESQNTIFLTIGARDLEDFWNKPDYPFNPHLTIYDGPDSATADTLYVVLKEARMFFKFFVSKVHVVKSIRGQGSMELISHVVPGALPQLRNKTPNELRKLSGGERLLLTVECLKRAKAQSRELKQPF